jgi:hypothetical protein
MDWGPLLERTHQVWKLHAAVVGVCVSILIGTIPFVYTVTNNQAALYTGISALVAFISLAVLFLGLKCPACRSNWMWRAARQPHSNWLRWLREQQVCPACGRLAVPSNNRWRGP